MSDPVETVQGDQVAPFDYDEPADLYFPAQVGRKGGLGYQRFPSAALALLYAIETLAVAKLGSATLEVDGERYDGAAMKRLYASPDFPLR
ncbi:MAG: hypothetical protein JWR51_1505 [Devosia sp.]|uniref:hypothetical protein n=1 Tax=Devosia sp. TaxID=1871048 RepID=UPI0026101F67|nr:hypothetical protein [Devosia sp.]MDB5528402.1 hypothetical protein [Devosia sp.]